MTITTQKEEILFWHLEDIVKNEVKLDSKPSNNFITTSNAPVYDNLLNLIGNVVIQKNIIVEKNMITFENIYNVTSTTTIYFNDKITSLVSMQNYSSSSPFFADQIIGGFTFASGRFFNKNASYVFNILPDDTRRVIIYYDN
jgi:hypothetical protein